MSLYPHVHFLFSAATAAGLPPDEGFEVAMAGRSNAGKSSAINAITARRALARTSKTPGRTRLLNYFELWPGARLVDLPGYGYASGPREERESWSELVGLLAHRRSLCGLMLVVDARRGIAPLDEQLLDWAAGARALHVLLSKADQLRRTEGEALLQRSRELLGGRGSAQLFSAHKGTGLDEARRVLDGWLGRDKKMPRQS